MKDLILFLRCCGQVNSANAIERLQAENTELKKELAECKEEIKADNESISQMHRIKATLREERDSLAAQVVQMREALTVAINHYADVGSEHWEIFDKAIALDTKPAQNVVNAVKAQALLEAASLFTGPKDSDEYVAQLLRMADELEKKQCQ